MNQQRVAATLQSADILMHHRHRPSAWPSVRARAAAEQALLNGKSITYLIPQKGGEAAVEIHDDPQQQQVTFRYHDGREIVLLNEFQAEAMRNWGPGKSRAETQGNEY